MTIKELLREISKERYDKKNLPFYIRKEGVGCWKVEGFSNEDSGFYLNAGEESNPQEPIWSEQDTEDLTPEQLEGIKEGTFGSE